MYLAHFGFTHYPFDRALQPDELFASSVACEANARLNHLVELRGIGLITGEVGSGKTTLCRQLCAALHPRNDVLEDLRLLTNYAMDAERRLCLLLVGLPELRRRLSMAVHESLTQ